eukprot:200484-Pleurochrysis_carterae.AAC.1
MRPRRKQNAAPRPASGYNVLGQVRRVHLCAGREVIKTDTGVARWMAFNSSLLPCTAKKSSFQGAGSRCLVTSLSSLSRGRPPCPKPRFFALASSRRSASSRVVGLFCKAELIAYLPEQAT